MKDQPVCKNYAFSFLIFVLTCVPLFTGCGEKTSSQQTDVRPEKKTAPAAQTGSLETGGGAYPTLTLDGLTWLAANLRTATDDSWCYGNQPGNCNGYGRLYRWQAAGEACSALGEGWRLPTDEEWQNLAKSFGGYFDWLADQAVGDPVAANTALLLGGSSGFDARLGGWRGSNGGYDSQDATGFYWSGTEKDEDRVWFYIFQPDRGKLTRRSTKKSMGMACRCVRKER